MKLKNLILSAALAFAIVPACLADQYSAQIANLPLGIASATTSNLVTNIVVPASATVVPIKSTPLGSGYSTPMPFDVWLLVSNSVSSNVTYTITWGQVKNINGTNYIATNSAGQFLTMFGLTNANQTGGVLLHTNMSGTNLIGSDGATVVAVGVGTLGGSTSNQQVWVTIPQP